MTHEQFIETLNEEEVEVALCVDCVFVDAYGMDAYEEAWRESGESEDRYTGFLPEWDGWLFGPVVMNEELEPTEPYFSWSRCDGCGSGLGGDRHRYIAVRHPGSRGGE